jgi:hypothetical protein
MALRIFEQERKSNKRLRKQVHTYLSGAFTNYGLTPLVETAASKTSHSYDQT